MDEATATAAAAAAAGCTVTFNSYWSRSNCISALWHATDTTRVKMDMQNLINSGTNDDYGTDNTDTVGNDG